MMQEQLPRPPSQLWLCIPWFQILHFTAFPLLIPIFYRKERKYWTIFWTFALEYKFAKEEADFTQKVVSNKMKALSLPFPLLPPYIGMVALDIWLVCLMGLFLNIRLLVLERLQDPGLSSVSQILIPQNLTRALNLCSWKLLAWTRACRFSILAFGIPSLISLCSQKPDEIMGKKFAIGIVTWFDAWIIHWLLPKDQSDLRNMILCCLFCFYRNSRLLIS